MGPTTQPAFTLSKLAMVTRPLVCQQLFSVFSFSNTVMSNAVNICYLLSFEYLTDCAKVIVKRVSLYIILKKKTFKCAHTFVVV